MPSAMNLFFFASSIVLLVVSSYWLVRSLRVISLFLRMSEFVTGFIILGIGTSLPELFVAINSALQGAPAISLGNVIGANILDLTLIIGIPIVLSRGIKIESKTIQKDSLYLLVFSALPIVLMIIGSRLSRIDGLILLLAFLFYIWRMIKQQAEFRKEFAERLTHYEVTANFIIFFISFFVLFKSAHYAIQYTGIIAADYMIPPILIGIFVLSFGTTLPELVTGIRTALSGQKEATMGNIMGTVAANSTLVIGVAALIHPIEADFFYFITSAVFMFVMAFLFRVFVISGSEIDWREGVALILLYILFIVVELSIKGFVYSF